MKGLDQHLIGGIGTRTVVAATIIVACVAIWFDAFDRLAHFVAEHEKWELDEVIIVMLFSGAAAFVMLLLRARELRAEVDRRKMAEERAIMLARHDPLTGLPNRRVMKDDVDAALARVRTAGSECAVLLIDLDLFKPVNDVHGHAAGDAVLVEVARRLSYAIEGRGTVARLGGDEFACVLHYNSGSDLPARIARNLIRRLAEPIIFESARVQIGATIGISRAPRDGSTSTELLHAADLAMYEGKRDGRRTYRLFDVEMDVSMRERCALEADLRTAVSAGEIMPYFQPIVDLEDGSIVAFEALARWHHPVRGMLGPDIFIPMAEDLGIIGELSYSMLRQACQAAKTWPSPTRFSINIAPVQLKDSRLAMKILGILDETGFAPGLLTVEITENSPIEDIVEAKEVFRALQEAGVKIALDDFGRGYSSLYHLRELRFNQLKIDGSFIHAMNSAESLEIVGAITGLGKSLGMPIIAEGVETSNEAAVLRALGCELAQGYLFGKPLSAAETTTLLATCEVANAAGQGQPLRERCTVAAR
jgi:diguanylate cyclase (GGDEF)-like protein